MAHEPFAVVAVEAVAAADHRGRLRAIFRDAVLFTGHERYSGEHVVAWSMGADDLEAWDRRLRMGSLWIATTPGGDVTGYAIVEPHDHVDHLYVDPGHARRGIAGALLGAIEATARRTGVAALTTAASLVAEPVFARAGYRVIAREIAVRDGLGFERARMRRDLS